ncbi:RINT1-like protein isoform X1 [Episyrphus balteatus]|uniref:RINT1-like protein isoform X1 n=1 Tax=Episyrphus balteatus TaxID=286459 RepID=UPI002485B01F|nr:RINT1-like protein isoform X1 [Episyrphus balteatus]
MPSIDDRVVEKLNNEIGKDFKKLYRASCLVDTYKQRYKEIEDKLNYDDENNTSSIRSALQGGEEACKSIDFQMEKLNRFEEKLAAKIHESNRILSGVKPHLEKVRQLQRLVEYLNVVRDIQDISTSLTSAINGRDETKMVNLYLSLSGAHDSSNCVIGRLDAVEAPFLQSFAVRTAVHWHGLLKEKFSNEFETLLKNIRWANQGQDMLKFSPSKDNLAKLTLIAEYLFLLKSPNEESEPLQMITPSILLQPISTVTKLLLKQYRTRFLFHFTGTKQTNRLDKPEWYFTQILNWIKDTHLFVGRSFQPAVVKAGRVDFNIRLEFIRGLVQLSIEKLSSDIDEICNDENLFAHLLDETLAFEAELRETFGYPASFPSAITVITQPTYLLKWISLEERFCADKMDQILQGYDPWTLIDPGTYDELKIPKCADQFIRLLEAIKDRYYSLIQPGHQLQFLNLQLELIDNFRRRLVQLHSCAVVDSIQVLNAINYINSVLREWGENVHYLHLHAALVGPNANEINSVFEHPVEELEHWQQKLVKNLATKAVNEIKAKSMPYRHDKWQSLSDNISREPFMLSTSAGEMFQVMVTTLHNLEKELSSNIFNLALRLIAKQMDDYFLDSMVMNTKFSSAGAAQFNYDMTRNLFALFGQYSRRPDLLFKKVHDICKLLTIPRGPAMLLLETLKGDDYLFEEKQKALKEMGVVHFNPSTSLDVIERRTDIKLF